MFPIPTQVEKNRFLSNIKKEENGCWTWTGYKMKNGYGQLRYQSTAVYTHRFSWYIHNGEFDLTLCLCHKCDNRACCNPEHMFLGTRTDNQNDMVAKKRQAVGQAVGGVFTEADVREMHRLVKQEGKTQTYVAELFRTNPGHISNIINGHKWGHLGLHLA